MLQALKAFIIRKGGLGWALLELIKGVVFIVLMLMISTIMVAWIFWIL